MRRIMLRVIGPAVLYSVFGYKQKENGMPAKIMVSRTDHTPQELRELASKHKFRDCRHRLRAIALAIEGGLTRTEIAGDAGVDAQTLCDWVKRYNEEGLEGLRDNARPGRPSLLDVERRAAVTTWLAAGPDPDAGEPSRWTVADIRERIMDSFGVRYTLEGVRRLIRRLGFRHVSPRPVHPRAKPEAQEEFRNGFARLAEEAVPDGVSLADVLVHFQDEARVGQKGMLSRVWARKGTRPRIVQDHRYGYVYLFSAACPETGTAVGHVCARANTGEMSRHLRDIGEQTPAGKHALVVLDGAGWHRSRDLEVPANVSLLRLPPYSPELNPVETLFSILKHRHFANRVFESAEHVRETVEEVWNGFVSNKAEIMRITARKWAVL